MPSSLHSPHHSCDSPSSTSLLAETSSVPAPDAETTPPERHPTPNNSAELPDMLSTSSLERGPDPIPFIKPKTAVLRQSPSSLSLGSSAPSLSYHLFKTALWLALAATVALAVTIVNGRQRALEFLTAYIVEYSLSVDNLFVFLLIFRYFRVPREAQETVLSYGILGAMVLRGVMIVCGKALVERFEWIGLGFAALLIYSAGKLLLEDDDDDTDLDNNRIVRFSKQIFPVSDRYIGMRFFVRENSRLLATPLMVVLISIELSDVVFALDSVPAVLGLSSNTFVIYTSNVLAIMGLRSLFFVLSVSIGNLRFLKQALAVVLAFIGIKMIAGCFGYDFSIWFSLCFVAGSLAGGVLLSVALPGAPVGARPGAGDSDVGHPNQLDEVV